MTTISTTRFTFVGAEVVDLGYITFGTAFAAYYTDRMWTNAHVADVIEGNKVYLQRQ